MQKPIKDHELSQSDFETILSKANAAITTEIYNRRSSHEAAEAQVSLTREYAEYRLGFGATKDDVVQSEAALKAAAGVNKGAQLAEIVYRNVDDAIGAKLGKGR